MQRDAYTSPTVNSASTRLRAYLEVHPAFYGSAAALLDEAGTVTASPYVYRTADGYRTRDLALPHYNIEAQEWIRMPLAANASIWTPVHHQYPSAPEIKDLRTVHASANERISRLRSRS